MVVNDHALLIACGITAAIWLIAWARVAYGMRITPMLGETDEQYRNRKVSIIVPARNEERDLETALRTLLAQQGVALEIIAINDHSTDTTGAILDRMAQEDERLTVIHDPELRPGWFGKANAMQTAAERATGDYLLFTDADIEHAPEVLWSAISEMERDGLDMLTLGPRMRARTLWENIDIPMVFIGLAVFASPALHDPKSPEAIGIGAFILIRRTVFEAVGGYETAKSNMTDDVGLAQTIKARGYRLGIRQAPDRLVVELFKTNRDAILGPTKNILIVGKGRPWLAAPGLLITIFLFWLPPLAIVAGLLWCDTALWATGLAVYGLQYLSFRAYRQYFDYRPLKLLAFPLVVVVATVCTVRALYFYYIRGSVVWRGREIKHT